jgi:hypothetical protein
MAAKCGEFASLPTQTLGAILHSLPQEFFFTNRVFLLTTALSRLHNKAA